MFIHILYNIFPSWLPFSVWTCPSLRQLSSCIHTVHTWEGSLCRRGTHMVWSPDATPHSAGNSLGKIAEIQIVYVNYSAHWDIFNNNMIENAICHIARDFQYVGEDLDKPNKTMFFVVISNQIKIPFRFMISLEANIWCFNRSQP